MLKAIDVAKNNHPHMSDSLTQMIADDCDIYVGMWAQRLSEQKTVAQVKEILRGLVAQGAEAERRRIATTHEPLDVEVKSAKPARKRGR